MSDPTTLECHSRALWLSTESLNGHAPTPPRVELRRKPQRDSPRAAAQLLRHTLARVVAPYGIPP
eukprot:8494952-Pyramimonas_sp.AAC.1